MYIGYISLILAFGIDLEPLKVPYYVEIDSTIFKTVICVSSLSMNPPSTLFVFYTVFLEIYRFFFKDNYLCDAAPLQSGAKDKHLEIGTTLVL